VSFHTLTTLNGEAGDGTSQILFGGDETGIALPSYNDSSWLLAFDTPFSASSAPTWTDQPASWAAEPLRRIRHTATAVTNGATSKLWVYGGLRSDGAGIAYGDLWQMDASATNVASSAAWHLVLPTGTAPPATYDHTATWIDGALVVIGGVTVAGSTSSLNPLSTVWRFVPAADGSAAGEWTALAVSGDALMDRRGHVAVALDADRILIHGGTSLDATTAYADMAILSISATSASWQPVAASGTGPAARWGHSAALVAGKVVMAFGASLRWLRGRRPHGYAQATLRPHRRMRASTSSIPLHPPGRPPLPLPAPLPPSRPPQSHLRRPPLKRRRLVRISQTRRRHGRCPARLFRPCLPTRLPPPHPPKSLL
jgi:hypothetical protein